MSPPTPASRSGLIGERRRERPARRYPDVHTPAISPVHWTAIAWSSAEAGDQHAAAPRPAEPATVKLDDGSYLISGWMPAIEFAELPKIPLPVSRQHQTIAGRDWQSLGLPCASFGDGGAHVLADVVFRGPHRGAKGGQGASASAPDATGSRIAIRR
jgi:hypothetical protein